MTMNIEQTEQIVNLKGLNTDKPVDFDSTLNVQGAVTLQSTLAVTGVATFTASPVFPTLQSTNAPLINHATKAAINTTATATAAQVATGYITSTSAAAVAITLPSGTDLGVALSAVQGTVFDLFIDNTAGANTVTMIAGTNGILSTGGVDTAGSFGDLTVASGATGLARYTIMFSSATAYAFTRTA